MNQYFQHSETIFQTGIFNDISKDEQDAVLAKGRKKVLNSGKTLFCQGDPANNCYLVLTNRLKLSLVHEEGKEAIVRYINPGEITAATVVFREKAYPATATAVGAVEVIGWDRKTILELMKEHPSLAINLLQVVIERLEDIQRRYLALSAEQVDQRLARAVLQMMRHSGQKTDKGIVIDFKISRQDLADYTGTTLYTVSRVFSTWEKRGWVISGREQIIITDAHALVAFAEKI